jgi:hypothetical protein
VNSRHGSGERYVRKHWYRVKTTEGPEMKIYFERQRRSSGGSRWRLYAVGWFTLALINAGLAQGKGRSGLAWWAVSLLLGPVATFLVVVLDPVKPQ